MKKRTISLSIVTLTIIALLIPTISAAFSVTTSKSSYVGGETITIRTSGAPVNSLMTIVIYGPTGDAEYVSEFYAASDGTAVKSVTIPSDWSTGTHTIDVKIDPSGPSASKVVSVVMPDDDDAPVTPPEDVPDVDEITDDPEGAADALADADPEAAADLLEDVDVEDAVTVLETMDADDAGEILNEMNSIVAAAIIEDMDAEDAGEIITEVDASAAADILDAMDADDAGAVMDNVETEQAADILVAMDEVEAVADIVEMMEPENAGAIFEVLDAEDASDIIVEMDAESAGSVMDTVEPEEAADIFVETPVADAAAVVDEMEVESFADVLEEITIEEEAHFAEIMNTVDEEKAGEVLLEVETDKSADIIRSMASDDLNAAAKRVEAAVKQQLGPDADPEEVAAKVGAIADAIVNDDVDALVSLFVEIANLPDTPSTVATIMESMQLTNVYTVITAWVEAETYTEIAEVYGYFTTNFIETVYLGMSVEERQAVYPYLNAATVAMLPEIGEITVSGLSVSPDEVGPGEDVTVRFTATNDGDEAAVQIFTLRIGSVTVVTEKIALDAGESTTVVWTVSEDTPGSHSVTVNGESASFTVVLDAIPEFSVSNLVIVPASVAPGERVTVTVDIENTGGASGDYTVTVMVDGVEVDSETETVAAGSSRTVSFSLTEDAEGVHEVEVDGLSGSFTVVAAAGFPWAYALIAVIVIAGAAYWYTQIRETE